MRFFLFSFFSALLCFQLASQPEAVELHLELDEKREEALVTYVFHGLQKGQHILQWAPQAQLIDQQAYRQNLKSSAPYANDSKSLRLTWLSEVTQWKVRTRIPVPGLRKMLKDRVIYPGIDFDWPLQWPLMWSAPIALSVSSKLNLDAIEWPTECKMKVDHRNGLKSYFFSASSSMRQIEMDLKLGLPPALAAEGTVNGDQRLSEMNDAPSFATGTRSRPDSLRYLSRLEARWLADKAISCADLVTDSLLLLGKERDETLKELGSAFRKNELDRTAYFKALDSWWMEGRRPWLLALDLYREQTDEDGLQFIRNKQSAFSSAIDISDPLGDTNQLEIRLRRWYLSYLKAEDVDSLECHLLSSGQIWSKHSPLSAIEKSWNTVISNRLLPQVRIKYRHDRTNGLLYVYVNQSEKYLPLRPDLLISASDGETTVQLNIEGMNDTAVIPLAGSIRYTQIDPGKQWPVYWIEQKSDLQLLVQFQNAVSGAERWEAINGLLKSTNSNLKRTAVGIGLADALAEIRLLAVLASEELPAGDWERLREDILKISLDDSDERVRSHAADALLNRGGR